MLSYSTVSKNLFWCLCGDLCPQEPDEVDSEGHERGPDKREMRLRQSK